MIFAYMNEGRTQRSLHLGIRVNPDPGDIPQGHPDILGRRSSIWKHLITPCTGYWSLYNLEMLCDDLAIELMSPEMVWLLGGRAAEGSWETLVLH